MEQTETQITFLKKMTKGLVIFSTVEEQKIAISNTPLTLLVEALIIHWNQ